MRTFEWIILISFIWLVLLAGLLSTANIRSDWLNDDEVAKFHPFFSGQKIPIGKARFSDFLWVERISRKQQEAIIAHVKTNPSTKVADLICLPYIKAKTVKKLAKYFN